jgi:hypothetical protein
VRNTILAEGRRIVTSPVYDIVATDNSDDQRAH